MILLVRVLNLTVCFDNLCHFDKLLAARSTKVVLARQFSQIHSLLVTELARFTLVPLLHILQLCQHKLLLLMRVQLPVRSCPSWHTFELLFDFVSRLQN